MLNILRSTLRSTFIYSIGNMSSKLLGIILIPLYADKLSISEYGMLGMLEVTVQFITAIFGMSLYNAFLRWYWDKQFQAKQKSMFFTVMVFVVATAILLNLILIPFHDDFSRFLLDSDQYGYYIFLILLISGAEALSLVTSTLMRLQEKPLLFTSLQVSKIITNLSLTVFFIVVRGKKIDGIYEAQLIGNMVYFLLASRFIIKNIRLKLEPFMLRDMLKFSLPLLLVGISGIILNISDRYILRSVTDLSHVGVYSLGFKISNTLRVFIIASVNLALHPIIFKMMDHPENKRFYSKVMTYFSFVLMFFALGLALFGKELIKLLAKSNTDYWEAFTVVPILILAVFFTMLRDVSLTGINITKKTQLNAAIILVVSTLNIGLNIVLIPIIGYVGAAVATMLSQFIYFISTLYFSQKYYPIPYELIKVMKVIFLGILIYLVSTLSNDLDLLLRIVIKSGLIILYPFVLYFLNFYEKVELERIRGFTRKWSKPGNFKDNLNDFFKSESGDN